MNTWTGKTSRRAFLHGSTALAGGMLIGCDKEEPGAAVKDAAGAGGGELCTDCVAGGSQGFTQIFDGKTLEGWHVNPEKIGHGTGGNWQVEDGVITGEQDPPGSGNGGILLTDELYGDFELSLDIKPDWGVCSGLFLRANDKGQCWQMMVDYHDKGNVGHIYGEGSGAFSARPYDINGVYEGEGENKKLVSLVTADKEGYEDSSVVSTCSGADFLKTWKVNDWNTVKVRCVGDYPKITTWINGVQIIEFDGATAKMAKYDKDKVKDLLGVKGSIAVQVHGGKTWPVGGKCRWKNISVKTL
ncbi:MAG: DUF1080 domain-containing protein [Verrucomicrobiota bacterium]